ncbi:MAG: InlB B-repeat-containing protein, partial [Clostridia bacterium]|nr:InlB B-repeat-containing protein [Clostridia bacterium]
MLKNIMKRTVCSFLALIMVVTSVCFFDLSGLFPTAEASSSSSTYTTPDMYIMVPETFYMTPSVSSSSTVQYYVNNTLSGTTISPDAVRDATSGKIYFSAASGTVTDLRYSILGTNISNVAMNSSSATLTGVTLTNGMSAATTRTLEWVFTCKIDGRPAEYHAYTVAYAPYYTPVGAAVNAKHGNAGLQTQGITWISGVHSYTANNVSPASGDNDNWMASDYHARTEWDGEWNRPLAPMITSVPVPSNNDQNITDWLVQSTSGACPDATFTLYDVDKSAGGWGAKSLDIATQSHIANITVDISRNSNFNTIPNVTTGFFVSDLKRNNKWMGSYGGYMANYDGSTPGVDFWFSQNHYYDGAGSFTATDGVDTAFFGGNGDTNNGTRNFNTDAIPYNGVWNRATPAAVTTNGSTRDYIHTAMCCEYDNNWIYTNLYLLVDVTAVNKEALRELVFEKQQQADAVTSGNYAALDALLKSAYTALGDPTASQATVDSAVLALFDASASADATKTTIVRHVDARTGKLMPGNNSIESITSDLYDTVTVTPNTYTGYTLTGQYRADKDSLFSLNRWNGTNSGAAINNNSVASKSYDALTDTLTLTVTASDTHTADYRGSNVFTSGYDYFAVDPQTTYLLNFEYAGTGNGDIGLHCYDENGAYLGAAWVHRVNHTGLMAATGSNGAFRSETFSFCPAFYDGFSSSLTTANALRTRYVSLCFGGYPNNAGNSSNGPAATAANPLTCIFRNVKWTPVHNVFDMNAWYASSSGAAGNNQTINSYDAATNTLSLTARANDTYTKASRDTAGDIRTSGYHFFEVNPYETYTVSYEYAGTGNGDIGVWCYDENGHYLGYAWYHKNNYAGMMAATGNDTSFQPGSFDFCPATYTRPSGNSTYITPDKGARTKYIALTFGGYPNPTAGTTPVTNVFRNVLVTAKAPNPDLFDSAAWAASSCAANGSGVSSVSYDAASDTITVVNSGTDTFTAKYENNILNSGYYYIPVDPDGTYTLDFDYASPTRAEVGVICYDANGNHIGNMWLFDSLKETGSTGTYRHHTEVICPQSNQYLFNDNDPARFDVHFIAITFGNYAESGQSAATCNYRNVAITETNELFDMAQWAFRSANRYRDGSVDLPASDIAYDSETKTLTITAREEDTISAYAATSLLTEYETVGSSKYPFYYTPVEPGTTYTFEGEYAGTGNGDLGVIEYKADGTVNKKTWCHTNNNAHDILDATGSGDHFAYFTTSITTQANTKYIQLCFGGYPNSTAATTPVTCVFRDVKMHRSNAVTVPSEDSVFTFYYRPNMYTVAFDGNGSTAGSMADQKYIYNTAQELKQNAFQRVFHVTYDANHGDMPTPTASNLTATSTFAGWATTANGTSVYANRQTVNNLTSTDHATVTLYATWTPGSVTLPQVTRGGYTFAGWYTAASGGENVGTTTYAPTEDNVTLYARWSPNTFTLTFDENGVGTHENMPEDMELAFDTASDPLPGPQSPKIDGWTFLGWAAYDANGGIGDEEENGQLRSGGRRSAPRRATRNGDGDGDDSEAEEPTDLTTVTYYVGDTIPAQTVNEIIADVGDGGVYTLYAVWVKGLKTEFVDYNNGTQRTREYTEDVYNGKSSSLLTAGITQGEHTGWETAGWTMSREKGVLGSALESEIAINSNDNLFDMTAWWASSSHINGSNQAQTYLAGGETLTSVGAVRDVMSKYNNNNLITENFNCIAVDPYKTYTLGVEYAGSGNVSGQVGVHFYDADGNFLARCWMFTGHDSGYGDPHRGGDHFGDSTGLTDFHQENIDICPMTFESSYLGSFTEAQRASVAYIALSFGNYSDDNTISASNKTTVIYRNVTFTENRTYYGVYTQEVALTYDKNTTDTVTNMPSNPAPQDRIANSALGFGDGDVFNPTFTLSSNAVARTGYT